MKKINSMISSQVVRQSKHRRPRVSGKEGMMRRRLLTEVLENRALLAGDVMYNEALPTDVNADGYT